MIAGKVFSCDMCGAVARIVGGMAQLLGWLIGQRNGTPDSDVDMCPTCRAILAPRPPSPMGSVRR